MVISYSKTLDVSKGVDNHVPSTMSKGTTLFSCSSVEGDRWPGLVAGGCVQPESAHHGDCGLWEALPAPSPSPSPSPLHHQQQPQAPTRPRTAASALTNLIQDLSLNEAHGRAVPCPHGSTGHAHAHHTNTSAATHSAPPTKRQCRSLSSDELMWGGCGGSGAGGGGARNSFSLSSSSSSSSSSWRPQGSRVWSWVEKRRWHSGPPMQRSSSVSLPSRSHAHTTHSQPHGRAHTLPLDLQPSMTPSLLLGMGTFEALPGVPGVGEGSGGAGAPGGVGVGAGAGPGGSLPRSRSQPCVLSERKAAAGMKRRRPDEHSCSSSNQEARPSLDLAKMTQKQHFHSLSCPGFSFFETCHSPFDPPTSFIPSQSDNARTCPSGPGAVSQQRSSLRKDGGDGEDDSSYEEEEEQEEDLDTDSACSVGSRCDTPNRGEEEDEEEEEEEHGMFWKKGGHRADEKEAACDLDGELDIDQIERN